MSDSTEATPQAGTEGDWVEQFRAHVEATYPLIHLWIYRSCHGTDTRGYVVIGSIKVDEDARGKGLARTVLTALCEQADQHGDTLAATPNPVRTPEWTAWPKKWARFHRSLGFVSNRASRGRDFSINETMYRKPKPAASEGKASS